MITSTVPQYLNTSDPQTISLWLGVGMVMHLPYCQYPTIIIVTPYNDYTLKLHYLNSCVQNNLFG